MATPKELTLVWLRLCVGATALSALVSCHSADSNSAARGDGTVSLSHKQAQDPGSLSGTLSSPFAPASGGARADGSSTGGGSFGDESSLTILSWAVQDLADQIAHSSPEIFAGLPAGWTQARLAQVIRDTEPTAQNRDSYRIPEVSRYGQRLMFNYETKGDGAPFITATRLFADAYSHYDVNTRPKADFYYTIEEVKLKLAHEAAHLMGLGLSKDTDMREARRFAKALLASLDSDNFECLPKAPLPKEALLPREDRWVYDGASDEPVEKKLTEFLRDRTRAYVFNRPTGKAAAPNSFYMSCGNGHCRHSDPKTASSGLIQLFAPRDFDAVFDLPAIRRSVIEGVRSYGFKEGYFSWNLVDLRRAVLTESGYRSHYKYSKENDLNNSFDDYVDFKVVRSSPTRLELEMYPPLEQENWSYYRSQGHARIQIFFQDGKIVEAALFILRDFRKWAEAKEPNNYDIRVPLNCVRSYLPLRY